MSYASILGLTICGAMTAENVYFSIPVKFGIGEEATTLQAVIDGIAPGILPLALFGIMYMIFKKKKISPIIVMLILMAIGVLGAFLGILST